MAVYKRVGKRWAIGMPFWLWVFLVGPFFLIYAAFIIGWDLLLFSWWALVATWKVFAWLYKDTVKTVEKIRAKK